MKTLIKLAISTLIMTCLVACGGGGGGGSTSSSQAVASTSTFQFRTANANVIQQARALTALITGTQSGVAINGTATMTPGSVTSTTFNGVPALAQSTTTSGSFTANGVTYPLSGVSTSYTDSNYIPLGTSGSEYEVVNGAANVPNTVLVNDTGSIFVANRYTDSTKQTLIGTDTMTYAILPDTANTALLKFTNVYRDTTSTVTRTDTTTIRITPTGGVTYLSESSIAANGSTLNLTFQ